MTLLSILLQAMFCDAFAFHKLLSCSNLIPNDSVKNGAADTSLC